MTSSYYIYIPSIIISLFLAFYILSNNKNDPKNISFFLLTLSGAIWLCTLFLSDYATNNSSTLFWSRAALIPAAFVPVVMVFFAAIFPKKIIEISILKKLLLLLPLCLFVAFAFTKYNVASVQRMEWGTQVTPGSIYYLLSVYFLLYISFAYYLLFGNYRATKSQIEKAQILYVSIGLAITLAINIVANTVLVMMGNSKYSSVGTASMLVFLGITIYAMVRKSLFNIKIFLTNLAMVIVISAVAIQTTIQLISSHVSTQSVVSIATLLLIIYGGILLSKSVKQEIKQREEVQKLATDLEKANEHLKELDKLKDDFLSMASHELNTPIAAIKGYLSMILVEGLGGKIPDKARTYLDVVFTSATRLANMVKDLLNVSRIESGRIHIIWEQKPVEDIINQAMTEVMPKAREAKHTLTFEAPKRKMPSTWFDVTRVTEVIINIIGNSIKYTPNGGKIVVKVMNDDQKIVISVEDNGKGIPKDRQQAVFEKFTQVDVLKDEVKGTGLGMYISKKFVELQKGKIWFHSDGADKGTTFFFSIPIIDKKPFDPNEGQDAVLH